MIVFQLQLAARGLLTIPLIAMAGCGTRHRATFSPGFESANGKLAFDGRFREEDASEPGLRMDNKTWPHGHAAKGIPHGALFGGG